MIATTDGPCDPLASHLALRASGWRGRVIPTYRPDAAVDPAFYGANGAGVRPVVKPAV